MGKTHAELLPEDEALLDGYLAELPMHPQNTNRLFAIGFLGLPGSGKSTLADAIGGEFDLPVNRSDQIRRYLNTLGFPGENPRPDIMAALAEGRTLHYYRNNTSAVIDANFAEFAASSRANARRFGAALLLIAIKCPDDVAIARLEDRSKKTDTGDSLATAKDYGRIKAHAATFDPIDDPYFTVDTTESLESQIHDLRETMESEGYLKIR